ncbi:MAG: rhodanese-like domain-containing protein, partial [Pseudomonadota bacterium]|nr:rhodanese-like domain-containing protein [Pseudomonadota bacterium]
MTRDDLLAEARASVNPVEADAAQAMLDAGTKVLDVREPAEYMMGHLPGAENVPRG